MTRRGTLAYYFVAIVVGCFFLVLGVTAIGEGSLRLSSQGMSDFFLLYFLALVYGSFTMLLFAFLLRRAADWLKWERAVVWVVAGAALAPSLVWALYLVWDNLLSRWALVGPQVMWWMIFGGAIGVAEFAHSRLAATVSAGAVGAATALVLHRIHRAFAPGKDPKASP
jgi:hypothetical protein